MSDRTIIILSIFLNISPLRLILLCYNRGVFFNESFSAFVNLPVIDDYNSPAAVAVGSLQIAHLQYK